MFKKKVKYAFYTLGIRPTVSMRSGTAAGEAWDSRSCSSFCLQSAFLQTGSMRALWSTM